MHKGMYAVCTQNTLINTTCCACLLRAIICAKLIHQIALAKTAPPIETDVTLDCMCMCTHDGAHGTLF